MYSRPDPVRYELGSMKKRQRLQIVLRLWGKTDKIGETVDQVLAAKCTYIIQNIMI